jgi:hypothetical protein
MLDLKLDLKFDMKLDMKLVSRQTTGSRESKAFYREDFG